MTLTHNTDPEHEVLFDMLHAPDDSDKNEFSIRYRDTGTVCKSCIVFTLSELYRLIPLEDVRHFPNERIQAMLPCWNWATNAPEQSFSLALPCTVAYAANRTILRQRYDGNLGLAMPR